MKKNQNSLSALLLVCIAVFIGSCSNNSKEELLGPCNPVVVSYSKDIKPIMLQHCSTPGCHSAVSAASGINLEDYANTKPVALGNRFMGTIKQEVGFSAMPQGGGKLDDCKIQLIQSWVNQGAPNN